MRYLIGTAAALGLTMSYIGASGLEQGAILPGLALGIAGTALMAVSGMLLNTFNIDWRD